MAMFPPEAELLVLVAASGGPRHMRCMGPMDRTFHWHLPWLETELYSVNQDDKMNPTRADYMQEGCRYLL